MGVTTSTQGVRAEESGVDHVGDTGLDALLVCQRPLDLNLSARPPLLTENLMDLRT